MLYGVLLFRRTFPVQERVRAGVSYKAMLQEAGILSCIIVVPLMVAKLGRVFEWSVPVQVAIGVVLLIGYGAYTRALGRFMLFFLMLIMIPLATTELGTDSWITDLMKVEMGKMDLHPGWVPVYTSLIMMILRFYAGPIVKRLSPLGLLAVSSVIAAVGLYSLSAATGAVILVAATIYGFGKTFFWPAMLGVVSERFPKGGALTLNTIAAVGVLGVGVLGGPFLGKVQDGYIEETLKEQNEQLHARVIASEPNRSVFGEYQALDPAKEALVTDVGEKAEIAAVREEAKKAALLRVTIFPIIMLICYVALIFYFRAKGGYKAEVLTEDSGGA